MKLNRNRPFGKIGGEHIPDGCTTPATYDQDGRFFDQFDEEIVPAGTKRQVVSAVKGEADRAPSKSESAAAKAAAKDAERHARNKAQAEKNMADAPAEPEAREAYSAGDLLAQCDTMAWAMFHNEAKRVLGAGCPGGKDAIIAALKKAQAGKGAGKGKNGTTAPDGKPVAPVAASVAPGAIDLAQWAMGKKEYLFGQVRGAIRTQYAAVVEKRRDAVHLLVDQKVVPAHLARTDFEQSDQ